MRVFVRIRNEPDTGNGIRYDPEAWAFMLTRPPKEWVVMGKAYEVLKAHAHGSRHNSWVDLEFDVPEEELWFVSGGPVAAKRGRPKGEQATT